jgi:hypothetical protein
LGYHYSCRHSSDYCSFSTANPGVWVSDGPVLGDVAALQSIAVGFDGGDGKAVSGQVRQDGWASGPGAEAYTVHCAVTALNGDPASTVAADTRNAALDLYDNCCNALSADPTLGQTVMRALPADFEVTQLADTDGSACTIRFGVQIEAFTL